MPVKHGLLALLAEGPAHGYQLKAAFEARTGGSWELNIGQVYSTLQRLERDGLVATVATDGERNIHDLTPAGRASLEQWYATPIVPVPPPRDELAIKILLAIGSPEVDVHRVIQRQRTAVVEHLQQLTRRKRDLDPTLHLEELLHLDALLFRAEAEVRWLDLCEARLRQRPPEPARPGTGDHPVGFAAPSQHPDTASEHPDTASDRRGTASDHRGTASHHPPMHPANTNEGTP